MKKWGILLTAIIFISLITLSLKIEASRDEINGLITEVDLVNQAIKVNNSHYEDWYYLDKNTQIIRNGAKSSLKACRPITDKDFQLAKLKFNDSGQLVQVIVEYSVLEGLIEEINLDEKSIIIKPFQQEPGMRRLSQTYYLNNHLTKDMEKIEALKPNDHIIIVTGGNIILKIVVPHSNADDI